VICVTYAYYVSIYFGHLDFLLKTKQFPVLIVVVLLHRGAVCLCFLIEIGKNMNSQKSAVEILSEVENHF